MSTVLQLSEPLRGWLLVMNSDNGKMLEEMFKRRGIAVNGYAVLLSEFAEMLDCLIEDICSGNKFGWLIMSPEELQKVSQDVKESEIIVDKNSRVPIEIGQVVMKKE